MGSTERRQRDKENLRRAILDAARELFVAHGFESVSLRKIADRIEYSPTTIYLHFSSKEEILATLAEEGFILLSTCLEAVPASNWAERMRQGCRVYFEFAQEHPNYYNIMFELRSSTLEPSLECHNRIDVAGRRALGFIVQCIMEGMERGEVQVQEHPLVLAHMVWASIHGAVSLLLAGRLKMMPDDALNNFFEGVISNTIRGLQGS